MTQHQKMAIWLFDSQCVLCDGGVQFTLKFEKTDSIRFVSIQSSEGRSLAQKHGVDPDDPSTFLFIENGIALEKSDAVIALSRHLKGTKWIIPLLAILPKVLRDFAYGIIAKHRYRVFGKKNSCMIPDPQNKHRFSL